MKHLLFFLLVFPFFASAQILEKQFVATVQYNGFTQINDSLYRGDLIEFRDVLIEGYQPSGVDSGFICLDGTGRAYRVEVVNSFDYSRLNVDLVELDDYDEIPIGVGIVAERYGSTYQIPNGLVNSIGISSVLQAKILNHNTKIAATTVQPPDTLYLQELSGTTAISDGDTIPLIDYVRVVDTPAMLLNYPSTAGYGIIDGGKTWRADTTSPNGLATRLFAKNLPTYILADRLVRSNGSNLVAGNLTDNGTKLQALLPWQFQSWTTAGRPTGVNNYWGYNSTTDWLEGYLTSAGAWISPLQTTLTGGKGTQGGLFYADANGRATQNSTRFMIDIGNERMGVGTNSPAARFSVGSLAGGQNSAIAIQQLSNNASAVLSYTSIDFYVPTTGLIGQFFGTASNYSNAGVNLGSNSNGFLNEANNGMLLLGAAGTNGYVSFNTGGYAVASERMRILANGNVGIATTAPSYKFHVSGTDAIGLPRGTVAQRPTIISNTTPFRYNTDSTALEYGESVGTWRQLATRAYARTLVNAISTANFANTNLTATGNRTHDWANYNFTWANMKKFMWGADSLFKITKEFSGYTYAVMRSPSGQSLLDLQGDDDIGTNSAEIRLTDTETGNIVFINHDDRGVGTDGFRLEHYNGTNYHNMLYVNKTSRLFWVNQNNGSSGTMYEAEATISNGVSKNIIRGSVGVFNTDSINATHYFKTTNNLIRNKDVFGVYGNASGAVDTMYFRIDKVGGLHQYKKTFLHGLGTTTATTVLGKNSSNEVVVIPLNTEQYNTVTSTTSPVTLSNTVSDNLINQGGTQATFTLNMPANPTDGQVCTITYNNAITTLTIDGNGETIVGSAVITGVPGSQRKFKFYAGIGWIKIY